MNRKFISKSNYVLHRVLNSKQGVEILKDFIESILEIEIKEISLNPYLEKIKKKLPAEENFGIAVAEALAYGKPVLISNQINIWREIEVGDAGIVASDTVEGATQVIQTWENMTPEQRLKMGRAARTVYEANFTVEAAAKDLTVALMRAVRSNQREKS